MSDWIEARIRAGHSPGDLYNWMSNGHQPPHAHHFIGEPWWEDKWVVRMRGADRERVEECSAVDHVVTFDPSQDEAMYGEYWPWAQQYFEASAMLFQLDERYAEKFVHCYLNARGMTHWQEARFMLRFAWRRATIGIRWRLYIRRRWEREQGPPVVDDG